MGIEKTIQLLIYLHASLGGIALLFGCLALITKKGKTLHKRTGIIFYFSMLASACTAIIISFLPNHENSFLFAIGLFSAYFILSGRRALRFKKDNIKLILDKTISWLMIIVGFLMIAYPIYIKHSINIILAVFGIVGLILATSDIIQYNNPEKLKKKWLTLHLSKMIGAYISASTAFVVVNNLLPGFYGWFIPGIIGGTYIAFWTSKLNKKKT